MKMHAHRGFAPGRSGLGLILVVVAGLLPQMTMAQAPPAPTAAAVPTITELTKPPAQTGRTPFSLQVKGTSFVGGSGADPASPCSVNVVAPAGTILGSVVCWNGQPLPTHFQSAGVLIATVQPALVRALRSLGSATITVVNPDGAQSSAMLVTTGALAEECSIAKTNHDCTLVIDRLNPLAPPTIQMYPKTTLRVVVKNPYVFERYFLDYTSGQLAQKPDVATSIATGLSPSLKDAEEITKIMYMNPSGKQEQAHHCSVDDIRHKPIPKASTELTDDIEVFYTGCLKEFARSAKDIYHSLESYTAPDAHPQEGLGVLPTRDHLVQISANAGELYDSELELSKAIAAAAAKLDPPPAAPGAVSPPTPGATSPPPSAPPVPLTAGQTNEVRNWVAAVTLADAVAKDLYSFAYRINDLPAGLEKGSLLSGIVKCASLGIPLPKDTDSKAECLSLFPVTDPPVNNAKVVTRQVTYAIDTLNLIQNSQEAIPDPTKKRTVASVTIFYGEALWEISAGTFFSTLADRSFSISPVLTNGSLTGKRVTENVLHPTVVPFAAANYRIGYDWKKPRWRTAFYWTFAVGINPNTVSTDFGTGPSISWRGLMFSLLWHAGHDTRLTQGLYKNEILPSDSSASATSQNYWRLDRVAFGISVRTPSLTGR